MAIPKPGHYLSHPNSYTPLAHSQKCPFSDFNPKEDTVNPNCPPATQAPVQTETSSHVPRDNKLPQKLKKQMPLLTLVTSLRQSESSSSPVLLCIGWQGHLLAFSFCSITKHPASQTARVLLLSLSDAAPEYTIALQHWINMQSCVKFFIFTYINHPQSPPQLYRSVLFVQLFFSQRCVFS